MEFFNELRGNWFGRFVLILWIVFCIHIIFNNIYEYGYFEINGELVEIEGKCINKYISYSRNITTISKYVSISNKTIYNVIFETEHGNFEIISRDVYNNINIDDICKLEVKILLENDKLIDCYIRSIKYESMMEIKL